MKPKYEIDQKVYLPDGESIIITGVTKYKTGNIVYLATDECVYQESQLSLTPPDDKKYYILYRSLDGLERLDQTEKASCYSPKIYRAKSNRPSSIGCYEASSFSNPPHIAKEYRFSKEELRDDGKTVVYVYEEV